MTVAALVVSCIFAAIGQLLFKWGSAGNTTVLAFANLYVLSGLVSYVVSTALWLYALAHEKLSIVFPFTALTFVLVYGVSYFVLDEELGGRALLGALLILGGLFLVVWP
jgi:drug/metabolite transporter (DMT)-like permease